MSSNNPVKGIVLDQPGKRKEGVVVPQVTLVPPPHRDWSTTLCGCCKNSDWCCYAVFCYFCVLHQLTKAVDEHNCVPCLPWCGLISIRMKMRAIYGIQGSACKDCIDLCFCNGCGACQMHHEVVELGLIEPKGCAAARKNCCVCYVSN